MLILLLIISGRCQDGQGTGLSRTARPDDTDKPGALRQEGAEIGARGTGYLKNLHDSDSSKILQ